MPNLTISVPEQLKADMDKYSEVNWSEICRNAISQYIAQRENPAPSIELDVREVKLDSHGYKIGYPSLDIPLRIHNKMGLEIIVDRILFYVRFIREDGYSPTIGASHDLMKRILNPNSIGEARLSLALHKEKIASLRRQFTSSFRCDIRCVVFADGFRNPYNQEVSARIPIDDWSKVIDEALKENQAIPDRSTKVR